MEVDVRAGIINCNCGVLGHVDSGKTSLVKALSTSLSTCALDKHPQSQQRGITLDLGFSAFTLPMPEHLKAQVSDEFTQLQFTLVDCPGHASLIRTIIGGAQIIDMMLLVIDANKGIQTQTAECIVIAEITTDSLIIVLNKIDALPEEDRQARIDKVTTRIRKTFAATKFRDAPIVLTSAAVGGEKVAALGVDSVAPTSSSASSAVAGSTTASITAAPTFSSSSSSSLSLLQTEGIDDLVGLIRRTVRLPQRNADLPFYFAVDHCFPIKGHGTVLTGTVLAGSVSINSMIELPDLQQQRKVKSMQMFRRPVKTARQGDRVGICVTSLDSALIERGIATAPGSVPLLQGCVCLVKKVRFFRSACRSAAKYHVSIGHATIVAEVIFFGARELQAAGLGSGAPAAGGDNSADAEAGAGKASEDLRQRSLNGSFRAAFPRMSLDWAQDFQQQDELWGGDMADPTVATRGQSFGAEPVQWALLTFQQAVHCPLDSLIIGSRLDTATHDSAGAASQQCRLAFYGPIIEAVPEGGADRLRIFNWKAKHCEVHKVTDAKDGLVFELIAWRLYSEGGSVRPFLGLSLETAEGQHRGIISAPFGSGDKFKVKFAQGAPRDQMIVGARLTLRFKRFANDKAKAMRQTCVPVSVPVPAQAPVHGSDTAPATADDEEDKKKKEGPGISLAPLPPKPAAAAAAAAETVAPTAPPGSREGSVESIKDEAPPSTASLAIVAGAFRMEEDIRPHAGSLALGPAGQKGELRGPFAKLGKCKVAFPQQCGLAVGDKVHIVLVPPLPL